MLNIGPQELLLILVIALIVVGPQRLPTLGRSIGRGLREIRKAQDEVKRTIQVNLDEEPASDREQRPTAPPKDGMEGPGSASGGGGPPDGDVLERTQTVPLAVAPDPTPLASDPPTPSEVTEISRTLGRSLGELRRAREEIRKSFRVDAGEPASRAVPPRKSPTPAPSADPPVEATPGDEAPPG